ncbi:Telomere length regulation protein, conserved domain [Dillenia turbinata]|uniref:Telomere length regulation protein, conserved domain n=1 Tax=Dillenia turbinata TaxID=194707 RepID=A0AAN8Z133_9MAGN
MEGNRDINLKTRRELELKILEKVGDLISIITEAKHVDKVICSLHSLAVLLFPLGSSSLAGLPSILILGVVDQGYKDQILGAEVPSTEERSQWWKVFYEGAAFPTLARVLLYDVASNWLACFPITARKSVYDIFFFSGLVSEVVQSVVPCLQPNVTDAHDANAIQSNAERLLVLCLLEKEGVFQIAQEFDSSNQSTCESLKAAISREAQLLASVPDKARARAPVSLTSHVFFKHVIVQLLAGAEGKVTGSIHVSHTPLDEANIDGTLMFVGEIFARICRRGLTDLLIAEMVPRILEHVQKLLTSNSFPVATDCFESEPASGFWMKLMEVINDHYSLEKISEQLLRQLATESATDVEAYCVLWMLFRQLFTGHTSVRQNLVTVYILFLHVKSLFVDKFLLWKTFPLCCLKWILQFAVLGCPPDNSSLTRGEQTHGLLDTVQRLVSVWSKKEFVQSAQMEQQAYVTAAVGLTLEMLSKEELDSTKDVMHSILQGVGSRLENPDHLVRHMASAVAFIFSKVVDPKNPLYLDDSCRGDKIDWEFGLLNSWKTKISSSNGSRKGRDKIEASASSVPKEGLVSQADDVITTSSKHRDKKVPEFKLIDPDEVIDPASLNDEFICDEDDRDDASESSESSSDSSLQPYDLSDDDTDLKKNISQLVDVVGALRKTDDADGVERAIDVAEKLVRASPDELRHISGDLVRTLVQVRCSDLAVEGEEESAEEKRQRALVALLVTCPFESLDVLNKLLYSPNVDVSQRILILDVMTSAAEELAETKTVTLKHQPRNLISSISEPWFLPSNAGPSGAGPWKETSVTGSLLNWSNCYERVLPSKPGQVKKGKTRTWSVRSAHVQGQKEWSQNKFPLYAAAFMLPAMQGFDKKRHGVDLLGRDFIVLGKLIYMLGICMKCAAMHPEASALASPLLDMLSSRDVCHHKEAYVRRSVLFAASCVLVALHPSFVLTALVEGNSEITRGLEWIRTWTAHVAESDTDRECYMMAMTCLQLHAEMALQVARALESTETKTKNVLPSNLLNGKIEIPYSTVEF